MRSPQLLAVALLCAGFAIDRAPAQTSNVSPEPSMRAVTGELIGRLDSKTTKVGDALVFKTKSALRGTDGLEIPKGSKLIARVTGVRSAGATDANAQVALLFDRIELRGGESFSMQAQVEALSPAEDAATSAPDPMRTAPSNGSAGRAAGDMYGSTPSITAPSQIQNQTQISNNGSIVASSDSHNGTNAGAIVAHSGDLVVRTTAIPGLLLANHEISPSAASPVPSAGQASSIPLGAGHDILLQAGTHITLGIRSVGIPALAGSN